MRVIPPAIRLVPTVATCEAPDAQLGVVMGVIARAVLGGDASDDETWTIGGLTLRPHQREAVRLLRGRLARHGGALLADEVGLGKTLVAVALMREARMPVVVAPAALRPMWTTVLARAGLAAPLVSFEALSRGRAVATRPDLLVVDEAHHARTPHTRRYAALAALAAGARTLLLSATPVHNGVGDLAALLALFLGGAAHEMDEHALAHHVVRRTRADAARGHDGVSLPTLEPPRWLELPAEHGVLEALAALPPPVPPADGGDGGVLLVYSLVRQWASSRGALRGALRRRLAVAGALADALDVGRLPTATELAAWTHADGVVQLAFAELVTDAGAHVLPDAERAPPVELREAVQAHAAAVRALLARLGEQDDPDVARAAALRRVRALHPGARIVAFTERAETVAALFGLLRSTPGVAALTSHGGRVAGGRCTRAEVLARFAPQAQGASEPRAAERIDLLLTTDLLSEGVSLHDASVVVHLDLPWSPARLEQRVGRVRRMGAPHERVFVYALRPPARADRLLEVERRLRRKLAVAARAVGVVGAVLPPLAGGAALLECESDIVPSEPEAHAAIRARLARWRDTRPVPPAASMPLVAVVGARRAGSLALVEEGGNAKLVTALDDAPVTDAPGIVQKALDAIGSPDDAHDGCAAGDAAHAVASARAAIMQWLTRRAAPSIAGLAGRAALRSRRRVLDRIAAIGGSAPRHRRASLAPLLSEARRAASAPLGVGAERVLDALAASPLDDEAWLRTVATFGRLHAPGGALAREGPEVGRVVALVVLRREVPPSS